MPTNGIGRLSLILSFDDCHDGNIAMAAWLRAQGLRATFFLETGHPDFYRQATAVHRAGHEVGSHTVTHPMDMKLLSDRDLALELRDSKAAVEAATGERCRSFCYPRGRHDERVREAVRAAGYDSARTTRVLELTTPQDDPYRLGTAAHMLDSRREYDGKGWRSVARHFAAMAAETGEACHVWGHLFELRRQPGANIIEFVDWCERTFN